MDYWWDTVSIRPVEPMLLERVQQSISSRLLREWSQRYFGATGYAVHIDPPTHVLTGYRGVKVAREQLHATTPECTLYSCCKYDAILCREHDEWVDAKCDMASCHFCRDRPARPSDRASEMMLRPDLYKDTPVRRPDSSAEEE